jgi:transcriptional regulator with XRE-family HTH domain
VKEKKPTPLLQKIFELRKAKKISLDELGKVMGGVNNSTASHIENGDVPLKAEHIPAIAKLLGVEAWELFVDYQKQGNFPLTKEEEKVILLYRKIKNEKD